MLSHVLVRVRVVVVKLAPDALVHLQYNPIQGFNKVNHKSTGIQYMVIAIQYGFNRVI